MVGSTWDSADRAAAAPGGAADAGGAGDAAAGGAVQCATSNAANAT